MSRNVELLKNILVEIIYLIHDTCIRYKADTKDDAGEAGVEVKLVQLV